MGKKHEEIRFLDFERDCDTSGKRGSGGGGLLGTGAGDSGGGTDGGGLFGGGGAQDKGGGGLFGGGTKDKGGNGLFGGGTKDKGGGLFGGGDGSKSSKGWKEWFSNLFKRRGGERRWFEGWYRGDQERIIMSPPLYADLGKDARNVFGKGYHFGLIKLDCKTRTVSGVEFSTGGVSNQESGKVFGSLETKYCVKEYGLTFSEKWNTDNTLGTEVSVHDSIAKGLKLGLDTTFAPHTGEKSGVVKSEFKNDVCAANCEVDLNLSGPKISAAAVLGYNGWLAGYQTAYDKQRSKIVKNNLALGYAAGDFILHTNVDNGQEFGGSIFHKVNSWLQTAIQINWSFDNNETRFGLGCKYDIDKDSALRAKVNNSSQIGIGYSQRLREGITVMLSALIDGKNFNQGGHKIGVALELEA